MSQPSASQLMAAAVYFLPALVFAIVADDLWRFRLRVRPHNQVSRLLPWLVSLGAAFYLIEIVFALLPADLHARRPPALLALYVLSDFVVIGALALTRHLSLLMPLGAVPPTRRWLLTHYGLAALLVAISAEPRLIPLDSQEGRLAALRISHVVYIVAMMALSAWQVARVARRGVWRPGTLGDLRTADAVILTVAVLGSAVLSIGLIATHPVGWAQGAWLPFLDAGIGLALVTPFAVRVLGEVVRQSVVTIITLAFAAGLYWGAGAAAVVAGAEVGPLFQLAAVFLPVLLLIRAQGPLRNIVDRILFRRSRRRNAELHHSLMALSPELGIAECCRQAMAEFVRVMQYRGAGLLLEHDGSVFVAGELNMAPLLRVWPRGAAADPLPSVVFAGGLFRELAPELQQALIEAEVVGVKLIVGRRRRWGYAFVTTSVLQASFTPDEIESIQALTGQFALILDAAELLERARAVERSLAHSEKLAAVGELAARVAHEIRNPVTAARSLAQLMVRDPGSEHAAEHAELILGELERVERQVQALLRFARREEFRFEPVDLGEVARSALEPLRARLAANGVAIEAELAAGVMARADREQIRQVVVNLLDNAVDAVGGVDDKRLALAVHRADGTAVLEVRDSGPGVPAEALPRLFEPFFSLKTTGTGLGLAIVKRTVEAHGGRVEARPAAGTGLVLRVELPVAAA
jgi:signal transduction histidine kinase